MAEERARLYGVYRAVVVDVDAPFGGPDLAVRAFPAVFGEAAERWALVAADAPGEGDTVVVAFEEGDVDSPIVIGMLWRSDD